MMRRLATVLGSAVLGMLAVLGVQAYETSSCPTEDSCQIDYSHGHWTVTEVQP